MMTNQGKKVKKATAKISKKAIQKVIKKAKKSAPKLKTKKTQSLFANAKKKMNAVKKQSSKTLKLAKHKIYATEEEIKHYVKENPIKSISSVALVGLIAGFISRFKK